MARTSRLFASLRTATPSGAATPVGAPTLDPGADVGSTASATRRRRLVGALRLTPLLVSTHLACAPLDAESPTSGTDGATGTESTSTGIMTEGCGGWGATGPVFSYGQGSIVEPSAPDTPIWTAPREACELATIVDFDVASDGATYALSTAFLHKDTCLGECPWRYWLRQLSAAAEEEWAKAFDFPSYELRVVRALEGGGVAVGGAANVGEERLPWLARFDEAGALLWEETFADPGHINAIARGPEDVVVAVGTLTEGLADELWVVQRTADGASGWTFILEDDRDDAGFGVAVDVMGRAWIVGGRDPWGSESLSYYSSGDEYAWWYVTPGSFRSDIDVDDPFVALIDAEGALVWLDELEAPPDASWCTGVGIDLLPGGDAIVGMSWYGTAQQQLTRYAADGTGVWSTLVTLEGEYPEDVVLDELACDSEGRSHVLLGGQIIQLDDAGDVLGTLKPDTEGTELALTPSSALWITRWRSMGEFWDTWHLDPRR